MPSSHFVTLEESVNVLKQNYLNSGSFSAIPTPNEQEQTRGFVVLFHAELEQYIEEALKELANLAFSGVTTGKLSRVAISLLLFSGIPAQTGGTKLRIPTAGGATGLPGAKKEKAPRLLATRYGEAHSKYIEMLNKNNGVREKYLAGLGIPIGLDPQKIDPNWVNDLETICSSRGAWAHMSRKNPLSKINEIDPRDIWATCERLIWGVSGLPMSGLIGSFRDLDEWIENEKLLIGSALVNEPQWRFKLFYAISMMWAYWKRRKEKNKTNDED
jgi:hypothetical protein